MSKRLTSERELNLSLARKEKFLIDLPQGGDIRLVLAYPNRYWVAMSNLGFQTIYKLFAQHPRMAVERCYLPEGENSSIKTFEHDGPVSGAQVLALSVSFETDYPHVLRMIEAAGVDIERCGELGCLPEDEDRPFILAGGAALTLNPEPLACFLDAIVVGEGEELVSEIGALFVARHEEGWSKIKLKEALACLDGVYVPSFYRPRYHPSGEIERF